MQQQKLALNTFYEQILHALPINLAVFDPACRYQYVSPSAVKDPERRAWLVGKTDAEYFEDRGLDPKLAEKRMTVVQQVAQTQTTMRFEEAVPGRDGQVRHFLRVVTPVLGPTGETTQVLGYGIDITERKVAEGDLRAVASRLAALIEHLPSGILVEDETRHIALVNQCFCDLFDIPVTPEALIGADCAQSAEQTKHLFADAEAFVQGIDRHLRERCTVTREELRRADGRILERDYIPIFIGDLYRGHLWQYWDVTDRKRAEAALRRREEQFSNLFHQSNDAIIIYDLNGHIVEVNQRMVERFGYAREAILGMHLGDLHPLEAHKASKQAFEQVQAEGFVRFEVAFLTADGTTFPAEVSASRFAVEGQVLIQGIVRDISAQRAAQKALRVSEARKSAILEAALDCIITIDEDGRIVDFNPAAERTFGYQRAEVLGEPMVDLVIPPAHREAHRQGMAHYRATGEGPVLGTRIEITALRADGTEFPIEMAIHALVLDDHKLFTAYLRDITERRWAEEELIRANRLAEQSVEAKERFLANMSHEMRTPLNAVIGMTHLLKQTDPTPRQQPYLDAIQFSADNLRALINDILDIAKIGAGKITFQSVPFRPADLVRKTVETVRFKAEEKGLLLKVLVDHELPDLLEGDPVRLYQILLNVIGNAIKFTDAGMVKVTVEVVAASTETVRVSFAIADTGIGIPTDRLDGIFESFNQVHTDLTQRYGGTGLGLTIVKDLVARQDGTLAVESTPGQGTTFTITLPFRRTETPPTAVLPDDATYDVRLDGIHVLVVEDNEMNQFVMRDLLEQWGAAVEVAANGQMALDQLKARSFDLVLMDIQMPVMDGYTATRAIRETMGLPADVLPVLALTASVLDDDGDAVKAAGMNDFILKPIDPEGLRLRIAYHLGLTATPPSVPYLDLAYLEASAGGRRDFIDKMMDLFTGTARKGLADLREALAEEAWEPIRFVAHKLRSSALLLGAHPLAAALEAIQQHSARALDAEGRALAEAAIGCCEATLEAVMHYQSTHQ